jgi:hypothetical protein
MIYAIIIGLEGSRKAIAFYDSTPSSCSWRAAVLYRKRAYYGCIIIIASGGGSNSTLGQGLRWDFS